MCKAVKARPFPGPSLPQASLAFPRLPWASPGSPGFPGLPQACLAFPRLPWFSIDFLGLPQALPSLHQASLGFSRLPWPSPGFPGLTKCCVQSRPKRRRLIDTVLATRAFQSSQCEIKAFCSNCLTAAPRLTQILQSSQCEIMAFCSDYLTAALTDRIMYSKPSDKEAPNTLGASAALNPKKVE